MPIERQPRVLVVDDELTMREFLEMGLGYEGFEVRTAADGAVGLEIARAWAPDLVILDRMLPGLDGLEVCRRLRAAGDTGVLMLSALGEVDDRIDGFDAGADDYLPKPFGTKELLARLRVALRHARGASTPGSPVLEVGPLRMDLERREATVEGHAVRLTPIEWRLLAYLARHAGKVLTHSQILREVWGPNASSQTHYVRVYMAELRKKLEADPSRPRLLLTEPGVGYRLADVPEVGPSS
jgi:two-component system KDP operon response regulator KdpE